MYCQHHYVTVRSHAAGDISTTCVLSTVVLLGSRYADFAYHNAAIPVLTNLIVIMRCVTTALTFQTMEHKDHICVHAHTCTNVLLSKSSFVLLKVCKSTEPVTPSQ